MKKNLIVILGPTASGKTALAARLAAEFKGEILSADSRQVYRGMNIGTGKDLQEFVQNGKPIPYHLIDLLEPHEEFNVFEFQRKFYEIFEQLKQRRILPILVGGTGLYLESVLTQYVLPPAAKDDRLREELAEKPLDELKKILLEMKPALHNKTDLEDRERLIRKIEIEKVKSKMLQVPKQTQSIMPGVYGITWERSELRGRIAVRLKQRIEEGMIEEVAALHDQGVSWEKLDSFGLEYRYVARYLQKQITFEEMSTKLQIAIGQFAKRQMTWFRRMEKKGVGIEWIPNGDYETLRRRVREDIS